ncbi:hypothetical protein [Tsuneonella sp. HG222]
MARKLKVFRTATGFHDAYVAAPSRKAALEAWGATADLFARGMAEEVTDPALTADPLARPGEVIAVSRGDLAAQIAALGPKKRAAKPKPEATLAPTAGKAKPTPKPKPRPRPPSRDALEAAEQALAEAEDSNAQESRALEQQIAEIKEKRAELEARHEKAIGRLQRELDKARESYKAKLDKWSSS